MQGLSLVAASGGHSPSRRAGLSLSRPLLLRSTGSRRAGSVVVAHGPSHSAACGIFPDQGSNPCPLHWQADSQPLRHQGSPQPCAFDTESLPYEHQRCVCLPLPLLVPKVLKPLNSDLFTEPVPGIYQKRPGFRFSYNPPSSVKVNVSNLIGLLTCNPAYSINCSALANTVVGLALLQIG